MTDMMPADCFLSKQDLQQLGIVLGVCHGAGKGHRGETRVWVQMLVKCFIKQQKGQQAKNRTENRVGHHRRQHSAGVLESREQKD